MPCLEYFSERPQDGLQAFKQKVSCVTQKIPIICLKFVTSVQKLHSLEITNLGWSLEKYYWLPTAWYLSLQVGAHPSNNEAIQKSPPSSNNRIWIKTPAPLPRDGNSGVCGLYCFPEILRGTGSQLSPEVISPLVHSLLGALPSLFYFTPPPPNNIS